MPPAENRDAVLELVGSGEGLVLDVGCGTGHYFPTLAATGRNVVGVDLSADQLRYAVGREALVAQADGHSLPFPTGVFSAVAALWISTDVDDLGIVVREAARVLEPGGILVLFGVHPCFNGPCIEGREDGARIVHPNYRDAGWHAQAPWWGVDGIRSRLGMRHVPLAELLTSIASAPLRIVRVDEPRSDAIPAVLAVTARREA